MARTQARAGWDLDFRWGKESENKLREIFGGEGITIEVKRDSQALRTGNIFIEVSHLTYDKNYEKPSGISVSEADVWAIEWREDRWMFLPREHLMEYVNRAKKEGRMKWGGDYNRSYGALIPLKWMVKE